MAVGVQHIVGRAGVAVVAGRADLARYVRTVVLRVTDAITVVITDRCPYTLTTGVVHVVRGAWVVVVTARSDRSCSTYYAEAIRCCRTR